MYIGKVEKRIIHLTIESFLDALIEAKDSKLAIMPLTDYMKREYGFIYHGSNESHVLKFGNINKGASVTIQKKHNLKKLGLTEKEFLDSMSTSHGRFSLIRGLN